MHSVIMSPPVPVQLRLCLVLIGLLSADLYFMLVTY